MKSVTGDAGFSYAVLHFELDLIEYSQREEPSFEMDQLPLELPDEPHDEGIVHTLLLHHSSIPLLHLDGDGSDAHACS